MSSPSINSTCRIFRWRFVPHPTRSSLPSLCTSRCLDHNPTPSDTSQRFRWSKREIMTVLLRSNLIQPQYPALNCFSRTRISTLLSNLNHIVILKGIRDEDIFPLRRTFASWSNLDHFSISIGPLHIFVLPT